VKIPKVSILIKRAGLGWTKKRRQKG